LLLDESFNVKICDFGLARLRDLSTVLTANVGTVQWMAPEVLTGRQYDESVDVYSLGLVAWEMMTGKCPYENMKQVEVSQKKSAISTISSHILRQRSTSVFLHSS
jgi:serine/threonine protein kinase